MSVLPDLVGVFDGMSNVEYHAAKGLSNSVLSAMANSPANYFAMYEAPGRPVRKPTAAMMAGTLAHCAILEPDQLHARYVCKPTGHDARTTAGRAWAASVPDGVTVIDADAIAMAEEQRNAVLAVPELAELLASGVAEQSAFWLDQDTSLLCKCRPDWIHPLPDGRVILVDVKTTKDASPAGFSRSVNEYGYHRQAAHYSRGYELASGKEVAAFVFAVVTNAYPYIAMAYTLDAESMQQGESEISELIELYAACKLSGNWPTYGTGVVQIGLPAWARRNVELEVAYV